MKKILFIMLFCLFSVTPVFAAGQQKDPIIEIDPQMLSKMESHERNAILDAVKKQTEAAEKKNKTISEGAKEMNSLLSTFSSNDVEAFKAKGAIIANTVNDFLGKLGVTTNQFISTPAGFLIILVAAIKLGVFAGITGTLAKLTIALTSIILLFRLNSKKKVVEEVKNNDGIIVTKKDIFIRKFNCFIGDDSSVEEEANYYALVASIVCFVAFVWSLLAI